MKDDITTIWSNFINGNIEAFAILYNRYVDSLFRYGIKITPDEETVKDSIQEIFLDLYLKRHNNKTNPENLKFYLILAIKRNLIQKLIKNRAVILKEINDSDLFEPEYSIEHQLIEQEQNTEMNHRVIAALNQLTNKQKEAIYLRFNESLEYKEIADILKITVESARKQVWRALKLIREYIKNETLTLFFVLFDKFYAENLSIK